MASSRRLGQAPRRPPPPRPTHSVAPLPQNHPAPTSVFTVQPASVSNEAWHSPGKSPPASWHPPNKPPPAGIVPPVPPRVRPLFDGLQALVYTGAALGIVPIALRPPLRLCFHPLRSTIVYALLVHACVLCDAFICDAVDTVVASATSVAPASISRFWSAHSVVHLAGCIIVPIFWAEASNIGRLRRRSENVMEDFGYVLWNDPKPPGPVPAAPGPRKPQQVAVWLATGSMWILSPAMLVVWQCFVEHRSDNTVAHFFINVHLLFAVSVPSVCCLRLRTFAAGLLNLLRQSFYLAVLLQEVADPDLTPERVLQYRRTWLHLTGLTSGLIVTPVSLLIATALLVILVTLHSYETVERITAGDIEVALAIWSIGVPFFTMLFFLCEVPHRSADVIRQRFMEVLQMYYCRYRNAESHKQLHEFLELVWWNSPVTSISGYFDLRRSSFKAIVTVVVTYVIVILQFHLSLGNSMEMSRLNGTNCSQCF